MAIDPGTAAIVSGLVVAGLSIFTLLINNNNSIKKMNLQSKLDVENHINNEMRELLYRQLSEFYNPIYSLLSVNRNIFNRIGPNTGIRYTDQYQEDELAEVWNKLVDNVIVENNITICEIIEEKLHLLGSKDIVSPYMEFITHAYAYKVFREKPYEVYRLFQFPRTFYSHVELMRNNSQQELDNILRLEKN